MICDHPECTGIHTRCNGHKWKDLCPAYKIKRNAGNMEWRDKNRVSYYKSLLQNRRYRALQRVAKRTEQYGKV